MNKFDNLLVALSYMVALAFIGWIFYLTRNPWTFLLLIVLPFVNSKESGNGSS